MTTYVMVDHMARHYVECWRRLPNINEQAAFYERLQHAAKYWDANDADICRAALKAIDHLKSAALDQHINKLEQNAIEGAMRHASRASW